MAHMPKYLHIPLMSAQDETRVDDIRITPENFHTLLNSVYHDALLIDLALAKTLPPPDSTQTTIPLTTLRQKHRKTSEKLFLKNMGETGLGAFLKPGESLDPKEDALIYSGLYTRYNKAFTRASDKGFSFYQGQEKVLLVGEGQTVGYLQHLPEAHTIPEDLFSKTLANNFNKVSLFVDIDSMILPLRCLMPTAKLQAEEMPMLLGFDYSPSYWFARARAPLFFNAEGEALNEQPYLIAFCTEKKGMTLAYATEKAALELCEQNAFHAGDTHLEFERIEKFDSKNRFVVIKVV